MRSSVLYDPYLRWAFPPSVEVHRCKSLWFQTGRSYTDTNNSLQHICCAGGRSKLRAMARAAGALLPGNNLVVSWLQSAPRAHSQCSVQEGFGYSQHPTPRL